MIELPEQDGWCLEMHGVCVSFVTNAQKAIGMSPGAETPIYTAANVRRLLEEAHEARRVAQAECERLKEELARIGIEHRRLIAEAVEKERDACAKVCDVTPPHPFRASIEAAHAIRARSKDQP